MEDTRTCCRKSPKVCGMVPPPAMMIEEKRFLRASSGAAKIDARMASSSGMMRRGVSNGTIIVLGSSVSLS